MRGRFYDWQKVHDGALEIIAAGIFEEPELPQQSRAGEGSECSTDSVSLTLASGTRSRRIDCTAAGSWNP